ncbi:fumarylacetoacetate hydrolase family protein [Ferrovibrio sp.]|uniref:fumarylacetoacetate hydrolase family protein n=1 Tax=Ferrovibrio sp. TaxID=1917215 RepID=UPI0035AEBDB1
MLSVSTTLPKDGAKAALAGRLWLPDAGGPAVIRIDGDQVTDITAAFPLMRDLCETGNPAAALHSARGVSLGSLADILEASAKAKNDPAVMHLLAPVDLQAVKACGVTFVVSLMERVIEEQARGNPQAAADIRREIQGAIGSDLAGLKPGSDQAMALKNLLIEKKLWSQYLEVGIGPDAEVFTKAPILSSVGHGGEAGLHPKSTWNNPEPEVVLIVTSKGSVVGAALGNDVNLRDVEGRSALLLGKAKDNNASSAIGPFIRFFDADFNIDSVRRMTVSLDIKGADGFHLQGKSDMAQIGRDPLDLVAQTINANHQYPDGFALFLGTMFAPSQDRDAPGGGFTHKLGDVVTISAPELGALTNVMTTSDKAAPWRFGLRDLMTNLARRQLL